MMYNQTKGAALCPKCHSETVVTLSGSNIKTARVVKVECATNPAHWWMSAEDEKRKVEEAEKAVGAAR